MPCPAWLLLLVADSLRFFRVTVAKVCRRLPKRVRRSRPAVFAGDQLFRFRSLSSSLRRRALLPRANLRWCTVRDGWCTVCGAGQLGSRRPSDVNLITRCTREHSEAVSKRGLELTSRGRACYTTTPQVIPRISADRKE